jgi:hypothetical protein
MISHNYLLANIMHDYVLRDLEMKCYDSTNDLIFHQNTSRGLLEISWYEIS